MSTISSSAEAFVGKALVMKRFHASAPRPRRRASRSRSRNLTIVVREVDGRRPEERAMGQKVNPIGLRLGINRTWDSRWFADKGEYGKLLHEDMAIREALMKHLKQAAVSKIVIERPHKKCRVTIHSARPGVVIGKKGADIDKLRKLRQQDDRARRARSTSSRCASPRSTRPWSPIRSPSSSSAASPSAAP